MIYGVSHQTIWLRVLLVVVTLEGEKKFRGKNFVSEPVEIVEAEKYMYATSIRSNLYSIVNSPEYFPVVKTWCMEKSWMYKNTLLISTPS